MKKGSTMSIESREKMSESQKGKHPSENTRKKMSESHKGVKNSFFGKKHSEETKKKIGENQNWLGKKHTKETRNRMSKSATGKIFTKEHLENLSKAHKGFRHSEKSKRKMGESRKGDKNVNWNGGITPLRKAIRTCYKYRQWISDCFTRDDYTCQKCWKHGGELCVHHKKRFTDIISENKIKSLEEALLCEEFWNINNGQTLCKECHTNIHKENE